MNCVTYVETMFCDEYQQLERPLVVDFQSLENVTRLGNKDKALVSASESWIGGGHAILANTAYSLDYIDH